nr:ribulose-phosphate 3-epimerase [FCB group bacterium]
TRLHLDVMDGHFVPNITFGPFIVEAIRSVTDCHLETHLMITEPRRYFKEFIDAGSDTVIFHVEASTDAKQDLQQLKDMGVKAGLSLNPDKSAEVLFPYLDELDYILIMSVFPGFGGQSFIESTLETMRRLTAERGGREILIAVDGGVNLETIRKVYETGIDITVVGSALFKAKNIPMRIKDLLHA